MPCARGSLHDVLDRYYQAARQFEAVVVVRITADCPLIDPALIDLTVNAFLGRVPVESHWLTNDQPLSPSHFPFDFAANRLPPPWGRTYPIGLDVEVCSFAGLETAWKEAQAAHQREHVMPYFYDHQERFRILLVNHPEDHGELRWTVDTPADLELLRRIFECFPGREDFSWLEVLALFEREPELAQINAGIPHKDYRETDSRRT
jgi:spore coat polysaccharide biosynthesis protein SpsF